MLAAWGNCWACSFSPVFAHPAGCHLCAHWPAISRRCGDGSWPRLHGHGRPHARTRSQRAGRGVAAARARLVSVAGRIALAAGLGLEGLSLSRFRAGEYQTRQRGPGIASLHQRNTCLWHLVGGTSHCCHAPDAHVCSQTKPHGGQALRRHPRLVRAPWCARRKPCLPMRGRL